jgi:hypothetical protein
MRLGCRDSPSTYSITSSRLSLPVNAHSMGFLSITTLHDNGLWATSSLGYQLLPSPAGHPGLHHLLLLQAMELHRCIPYTLMPRCSHPC